ncbi:MAG: fatty acid desaturase [Granulosicoccus sp.]
MNEEMEAAQAWVARLAPFRKAANTRSWLELFVTLCLFVLLWVTAYRLLSVSVWHSLPVVLLAGAIMVRLFIIQHDCGHGSFFSSKQANSWVGRALGILTLTPYDSWKHMHAVHHAGSGNLERRGVGDIDTLTTEEYLARTRWGRFRYRLYRHPLVMFGLGPAYLFLLRHRWPLGGMKDGVKPWLTVMATNAGIVLVFLLIIHLLGLTAFFVLHLPMILIGASIGVWMFYIQHQFDDTHWDHKEDWTKAHSALHGSSFYDLPKPMMWLTGNIGIHHVHHLSSRIPFYKLPDVLEAYPEFRQIGRLTLLESLKCVKLALWDHENKRMVTFREIRS